MAEVTPDQIRVKPWHDGRSLQADHVDAPDCWKASVLFGEDHEPTLAEILEAFQPGGFSHGLVAPPLWERREGTPSPFTDQEQRFGSWPALRDAADACDDDLNIVIWWSWSPPDPSARHGGGDTLTLMVAIPNSERVYPWSAEVSREEEPEIRAWLQRRLARLMGWWQLPPTTPGRVAAADGDGV